MIKLKEVVVVLLGLHSASVAYIRKVVTCLAERIVEVLTHQACPIVVLIDLSRRGLPVCSVGHVR